MFTFVNRLFKSSIFDIESKLEEKQATTKIEFFHQNVF